MFKGLFFAIILIISFNMNFFSKKLIAKLILIISFFLTPQVIADNHNIYEILENLQKDIKTLEKAVYSNSVELDVTTNNSSSLTDNNSEDVLTRHLLKLSEIENEFQKLTNKFEEINFKLDKLSNRLSKVQADNQIRFQDLENGIISEVTEKKFQKKLMMFYQEVRNHKI